MSAVCRGGPFPPVLVSSPVEPSLGPGLSPLVLSDPRVLSTWAGLQYAGPQPRGSQVLPGEGGAFAELAPIQTLP